MSPKWAKMDYMSPKWTQNEPQNEHKIKTKRTTYINAPKMPQNAPKMLPKCSQVGPKCTQNEPKMQPKWAQNSANPKMLLKCSQVGPTCIENELKMHPKWCQVDPRCSQMHQNRFNCPLCWRGFWDFPGFPRNVAKIFKLLSRCSKKVPQSRSERSERRSVLNYILRYLKI